VNVIQHHISCHQPNACRGTNSPLIIMEVNLYHKNFFYALQCSCHIKNIVIFQHHPHDRKSDGFSKGQKVKLL
jgi:hypothetical protein